MQFLYRSFCIGASLVILRIDSDEMCEVSVMLKCQPYETLCLKRWLKLFIFWYTNKLPSNVF